MTLHQKKEYITARLTNFSNLGVEVQDSLQRVLVAPPALVREEVQAGVRADDVCVDALAERLIFPVPGAGVE